MYRAKRAQSRCEFFSPDIEDEAPRRLILVTALKRAIDVRAITMHYQPKFELARRRVVGVEALARWTDPVVGPVLPDHVRPARRAHRPRRAAHRARARDRRHRLPPLARRRLLHARRGERAGAGPARPGLPPPRGGQAARHGPRRGRARDRDHREHADGRPRPGARRAHAPARHRRAHLDRRLRHGLLVALLSARAARARAQDRPLLHHRPDSTSPSPRRSSARSSSWRATCGSRRWPRAWRTSASASSSSGSAATTRRASRSPARCRRTLWAAGSASVLRRTTTRPAARAGAPRSAPSSRRFRSPRSSTSGGCGSSSCL